MVSEAKGAEVMQSIKLTVQEKFQLVKDELAKLKEENEALKLEVKGLRLSLQNALRNHK
jgi:regulator of replication initiation timing